MIARSEAEEHLRIIRSMMEKATIYRALSAPAALVGGLLSIAAAVFLMWYDRQHQSLNLARAFGVVWTGVFLSTAAVSLFLLRRDAVKRGEPFFSIGARSALSAMLPGMGFAGLYTLTSMARGSVQYMVPWWISLYGLALLAMNHFAPRSIAVLGWAFLVAGAISVGGMLDIAIGSQPHFGGELPHFVDGPCILMAATFGCFHLIYGVCTWPRRQSSPAGDD